jgi:hypothetical protein
MSSIITIDDLNSYMNKDLTAARRAEPGPPDVKEPD